MVRKDNRAKHRKIALISLAVLTIILYALGMNQFSFVHKKKASLKNKSHITQTTVKSNKIWNLSKILNMLPTDTQEASILKVNSMDELSTIFQDLDYNLKHIRCGASDVPSVFLEELPGDMGDTRDITLKKEMFIKVFVPIQEVFDVCF